MTYNRSEIMKAAWTATQAQIARHSNTRLRTYFAMKLQEAWAIAKSRRRFAEEQAKLSARTIDGLRNEIEALENTDTLGQAGINRLAQLRAALVQAEQHEQAADDYSDKRALIASAGSRFCAVTFIKADGTERTMQVQPATLTKHIKGDKACKSAQRAVKTRKARHPHLMPVWDAQAKAPRSVNLATVKRIAIDGQVHTYAA